MPNPDDRLTATVLPEQRETPGAESTLQTDSRPGESSAAESGRYQILEEIARGGMGIVLRAVDRNLDRPLAVKVMSGGASEEAGRRFMEEARIMGRLQHPGVAPVHEIGTLPDGRPFFSMKLIEGRTLAGVLADKAKPGRDDLPRLLLYFEQVAQTLAYAHSQSVIHRDLKPSNIMVGAFGEVQVMDWGLAKQLSDDDASRTHQSGGVSTGSGATGNVPLAAEEPTDNPASSITMTYDETPPIQDDDQSGLTRDGQILGTLAYMAPEQARGDVSKLDQIQTRVNGSLDDSQSHLVEVNDRLRDRRQAQTILSNLHQWEQSLNSARAA